MTFTCKLSRLFKFKDNSASELLFEKWTPSRPSSAIIVVDNQMKGTVVIS